MDDRARAAGNNAAWCDLVWRSHGLPTIHEAGFWATAVRAPELYPDAVTLDPAVTPAEVLSRIDDSAGASIKDSYALLDLRRAGYGVLFEADWYLRAPAAARPAVDGWMVVETPAGLASWATAHGGGDVFRVSLLADPSVRVLVRHLPGGSIAGAIASRAAGVVGVSNVFAPGPPGRAWEGLVEAIGSLFPGEPMVGYGAGERLRAAVDAGFRPIGPLRVWIRR